ncbi:MAG: DUF2500 domain-containing protein [Oscillospiraceae bacterium]|jgi:hypothetical protein|nr:DUF2500 domain-containing protein [Oscillospiraceae bacterium]
MWFNYISWTIFTVLAIVGIIYCLTGVFAKTQTVKAKVIDKDSFTSQDPRYSTTRTHYVLTFDCGDKSRKFFVSCAVWDSARKGERGTLTFKGESFISFE